MATKTYIQHFANGTHKLMRRSTPQGRRPERKYVKVLVRVPVEYHELMKWNNEECGGRNSITDQIRNAIRASLCGCVYTQLFKQ